jgi:CHAD domain-containing protein/CYTH domain-containing protein
VNEPTPVPPAAAPATAVTRDLLSLPAAEGAAVVARRLLADVAERRLRLVDQDDADALHDFRVALRRLRSWLRAFDPELDRAVSRKTRRRLRVIARTSNESRDGEVQLAWLREQTSRVPTDARPGLDWFARHLATRKRKSDERFRKRLAKDFDRTYAALDEALASAADQTKDTGAGATDRTLSTVVASLIRTQTDRLELRLAAVRGLRDGVEAHRARVAGKQLRYVLEPVADSIPGAAVTVARLKALQDALGELHDAHILIEAVAGAIATAAEERAQRFVAAVRTLGTETEQLVSRGMPDVERGLLVLAEHLHGRVARAFEDAREGWLGVRGETLLADVAGLARGLDSLPTLRGIVEIERKFLLREVPQRARDVTPAEVEQGYVQGDRLVERLRHVRDNGTERWLRTVKYGKGLMRTELEEEMMPGLFAAMWPLTEGRRVRKRRFAVPEGSLTWEIDEFLDRDLVLAEVELPSADATVELPGWLAPVVVREVTGDDEFANEKLAR